MIMISQIIQELYEVINRYPNNKQEVLASLKGVTASHEYTTALELYEANSALAMKELLGGQTN